MSKIISDIKHSIKIKGIKDLFRINSSSSDEIFHSDYLFVFAIEFILFGILSLYFHKSSKNYLKNIENNIISGQKWSKEKYDLLYYLFIALFFRALTFIYFIIFSNKTKFDFISYINFLLHVFPSFFFLLCFYINIGYLIEKFYEFSYRRISVLTALKYILYFSILLITLLSITVFIFRIFKESYFFVESLMCLNYLIMGFLYFIYGRKLSNYINEMNNGRIYNPIMVKQMRSLIKFKIILTCLIICPSYIIVGAIKGLVAIDFFGVSYPNFMDLNLYDSIVFFFCELLPSFIIGRTNKMWNKYKIEEIFNPQMRDEFSERSLKNRDERIELIEHKDLENEIKDAYENFEKENNYDKFS